MQLPHTDEFVLLSGLLWTFIISDTYNTLQTQKIYQCFCNDINKVVDLTMSWKFWEMSD